MKQPADVFTKLVKQIVDETATKQNNYLMKKQVDEMT
jgi:hypothetical protein